MTNPDSSSTSSSAQLVAQLHRVAQQAQKSIRYRAILACVAAVLAVLGSLMFLDCLFQREETSLRWLASILFLVATIYAAYRWLGPIGRLVIGPSDVARWIEAHQPEWSGRILTTLELSQLQQNDGRFGSEAFRAAALQNWQQDSPVPQWDRLLDKSRLRQAASTVAVLLILLLFSFMIWPDMGFRSLARVLAPWADRPWPRRDQLQFVNLPSAVGRETILQVEVADSNPPLPENIKVELRQVDAEDSVQSINTQIVGDVAVANLPPINSDIQVRAIGGDDRQMPWQTIRAVTTPTWKQFHFQVKPPDYLRSVPAALDRLTKQLDQSNGSYELVGQRIQIVEGSAVRFEGKLDASVSGISIRWIGGSSANASAVNLEKDSGVPLVRDPWTVELLTPDTVALRGASDNSMAVIDRSLVWKFQIKSLEGVQLECPEKWQIEVIPDSPPEVALNPMLLKSVALGANLHFEGTARDDWGLSQLAAKLVVNEQNESEIELPLPIEPQFAKQVAIEQSWSIVSALEAKGLQLKAQDQITFWVEAKDLRGQTVRSSAEKLYIDSKQKQLDAIANRQGSISQQISELLKIQQSAQQLARRNADSIKQSQQQTQQQVDAATSVTQMQQTIQQQLAEASQSVLSTIESQLDLIEQNKLSDSPLASQLNTLKSRVNELADGAALDALRQADQLQHALENSVATKQSASVTELTSALENSQSKTNQALSNLLAGLDRSELANRQRDKLLQIAEQQAEVGRRTNQLGLNANQRPQEAQAEAEQVGAAQNELAGAMEQWLASILQPPNENALNDDNAAQVDPAQPDPAQQAVLREVAKTLVDQSTASQMRSSGSSLRAQQLGEALQTQKQIQQALQTAIEKMTPRESSELMSDLAEQERQSREFAKAADQLATAQQQLARKMADPKSRAEADRMAKEQRDLLESTKQLAQQLSSDQIAEQLMQQAMANQDQAAQSAQEKQLDRSAEKASAAAEQLKDLAQRVQQQAENASQQVQRQQIFELISAVEQIALRQKELMPQYSQLVSQLQLPSLPADHVQLRQDVVKRQAAVRDQLRQIVPSVEQLAVFQWVLGQADGDLSRAIAAAERNRLQPDAVNAATAGLRKLEIAINTVKEKSSSEPDNSENQDQQQSDDAQDQAQQEETLPPIVSLKLIRALQLELKQQTELLESSTGGDRIARANELMGQQRELAELLERLINDLQDQQQNNN